MNTPLRFPTLLMLVALAAVGHSCNQRESPFGEVTAPTPPVLLSESQRPSVSSVVFRPGGGFGPTAASASVMLTYGAPPGGVAVTLSSTDPAYLSVPSSVVVPGGQDSVTFAVMVPQAVSADRTINVTATSAAGRSASATFGLWAILPTFFSFASDPGDYIGGGGTRRLTPPYKSFSASCRGNLVELDFWDNANNHWGANFQAPKGQPLRVGTYDNATRWPFQRDDAAGLDISGEGRGCNESRGRFTVREADFSASGQIRQFWATFEQSCGTGTLAIALRGDVRLTGGPPVANGSCMQ